MQYNGTSCLDSARAGMGPGRVWSLKILILARAIFAPCQWVAFRARLAGITKRNMGPQSLGGTSPSLCLCLPASLRPSLAPSPARSLCVYTYLRMYVYVCKLQLLEHTHTSKSSAGPELCEGWHLLMAIRVVEQVTRAKCVQCAGVPSWLETTTTTEKPTY